MDATRTTGWAAPLFAEKSAWRAAMTAAANCDQLHSGMFQHSESLLQKFHHRQFVVAEAAQVLRKLGYKIEFLNGRIHVDDAEERRIAKRIEAQIKCAGGINVAGAIFHSLRSVYDAANERYSTTRNTGTSLQQRSPTVPLAYLLNLCVEHLDGSSTDPSVVQAAINDSVTIGVSYAAIFDLEPYSTFEIIFRSGEALPIFLQELSVFDGIFTLAQARPSVVEATLRELFGWVDEALAVKALGGSVNQVARIADAVLKSPLDSHLPTIFRLADFNVIGVSPPILAAVLKSLSHRAGVPNRNYLLPREQTKVDFWFKPLIEFPDGRYLLMNRSWCAPAFYEAIAAALRKEDPVTDSRIGTAFEQLVRGELTAAGITVKSGTYIAGGVDGECDAVVETANCVILIELKKKPLRRLSRSGSDVDILFDLSESLLAAMTQIGQHELLLRRHGSLELKQGGSTHRIDLHNRQIERVVLSLLEFGAIQDRAVITQILETLVRSRLGAKDPKFADKIVAVQRRADALRDQERELAGYRASDQGRPFLNCWFLNLDQFRTIVQEADSNDSFQRSLFMTRHIVTGSLDLYRDQGYMKGLHSGSNL
jgi:hypothetical protein